MAKFVTSILYIIESNKFYQWIFISCTYSADTRISSYCASSRIATSCITPNIFAIKMNYYNFFIDSFKLNLLHNWYRVIITKKIYIKRIIYQINIILRERKCQISHIFWKRCETCVAKNRRSSIIYRNTGNTI